MIGSAGIPNGDVGGIRFMASVCESSIVPPQPEIWLMGSKCVKD